MLFAQVRRRRGRVNHDIYTDAKLFNYHCDQIGTPRLLTDDDGDVVWEASYNAWGEAREVIARASKAAGIVARNSLRFQG
ncbi:RHS protein [Burkholderia multivorans CF2]|nr:RHS domain-containing protein [Burkholderia multivorans]EJO62640.1 RHS protein [Burkholderia multivorans CF2]